MNNPLEQIQPDFAARLKSLTYFADIMVGAPRLYKEGDTIHTPKTISDQVDKSLQGYVATGGKIGAAIRVFQAGFNVPKPNLPGPHGNIVLPIRCEVNPLINFSLNGTNKYVSAIGMEVLRAGHNFRCDGICGSLFALGDCFTPYYSEETKMMTVDITLQAQCPIVPISSVVLPTIAVAGLQVMLTNNTAGADIYYTTDESFPWSGNATATLYAAPFNVISGTVVRWAAYKTSLAGSNVGYRLVE